MKLETKSPTTVSVDREESLARAIVQLNPKSARAKRVVALVTIGIPAIGFAIAVYLMFTGRATALDYTLFAVFYAIQMFGVSIGFHRYLAHKSFKTSRFFEGVLMITGSMALEGPLLFWVSTHRRHHRFSDEEGDPHSPNLSGAGLAGQVERSLVRPHSVDVQRSGVAGRPCSHPMWCGIAACTTTTGHIRSGRWRACFFPAVLGFAIGGTLAAAFSGFIFGGLARVFVANQAAWCVGSVSHMIGSRPFVTRDDSANNWPVAILTFGEGLQNNHHAFPGAYRHAMRWWEPDLSGWVIAVLAKAGVVWDLKMPDREKIDSRLRRNRTRR